MTVVNPAIPANLYYVFVNMATARAVYVSIRGDFTTESHKAAIFDSIESAQHIADAMAQKSDAPECIVMRCRMVTDGNRAQCDRTRAYWQSRLRG